MTPRQYGALKHEELRDQARVEVARRRFEYFIQVMDPSYKLGWAFTMVARRLQRFYDQVQNGESPRLMIYTPPRAGKSSSVSQFFAAWALGNDPTLEVVVASYGLTLPAGFSRKVRDIVRSDGIYHKAFPETNLHPENQSVDGWDTTLGGGYRPVGRGGALTGHGAHCLIIDDLLKDAEESDSFTIREACYDWYSSTAYTRLYPGAGVIVVATRWHIDDLAGRLLNVDPELDENSDRWEVINLQAIAEKDEWLDPTGMYMSDKKLPGYRLARREGEALHPERMDLKMLKRYKAVLQPRHWSALYQQDPQPEEGAYFNLDDIRFGVPPLLDSCDIYIAADTAASTADSADDSCIAAAALDPGRNLWVLDMDVGRKNSYAFIEALLDMYVRFPATISMGIESGPISLAFMPLLQQRMQEREVYPPLADEKFMRPSVSKEIRARPFQGLTQGRRVWFPHRDKGAWVEKALAQMKKFPQGKDDIVDTLAWIARLAMSRGAPRHSKPARHGGIILSWRDRLKSESKNERTYMSG